ncbi:hypothetical protein K491DRAFT_646205 [Lophiostoma macrostomum CBS 122681]|uniref:Thioredoxin domain-containing protein n=1 Tax=Lophiostoma macrostomum CBS 122681 TaxID=1314788 RepID=A0A6A6TR29_9PLEO|nr:hypothetical protein K491DRAFT_646205 [Lophiostoma macrostomum CBS 122681]
MRFPPLFLFLLFFLSRPLLSTALLLPQTTHLDVEALYRAHPRLILLFTNPSDASPSLRSFQTVFEKAAGTSSLPFAIVDCEKEGDVCREQDVNAYPAVRLFIGEKEEAEGQLRVVRYRGKKSVSGLRSFAVRYSLPRLSHVSSHTTDELERFKKVDDVVVVAFLRAASGHGDGEQGAMLLETYKEVAEERYTDFVFGYVDDDDVAQKEGVAVPSIVCYKNADGDHKSLAGAFTKEDVEDMLEQCSKDVIGEFQERNMEEYLVKNKLALYIFAANEDEAMTARRELTPLAKKYNQYVKMGVADAYEYGPMAKNFGLGEEKWPAVAVHAPMNDNIFVYRQGKKILAEEAEAMLMTILQGKADNGQVFGEDADDVGDAVESGSDHDEL